LLNEVGSLEQMQMVGGGNGTEVWNESRMSSSGYSWRPRKFCYQI